VTCPRPHYAPSSSSAGVDAKTFLPDEMTPALKHLSVEQIITEAALTVRLKTS
jgi:hypothetical protein